MFTSHFNPERCFEEAKNGRFPVKVHGDWIPRHIRGKFHIFFALLRSIWLALCVVFSSAQYDLFICDQISMYMLVLKLFRPRTKVLFYCHFPDQLLVTGRDTSLLKRIYRAPFDMLEELTTALADEIVVNSKFTRKLFKETFQLYDCLGGKSPNILYPCVSQTMVEERPIFAQSSPKRLILSINRYERKKNLSLLLHSFAELLQPISPNGGNGVSSDGGSGSASDSRQALEDVHLIIAGGYDSRVQENVEHFEELVHLADSLGLCRPMHTSTPGTTSLSAPPGITTPGALFSLAARSPREFRARVLPQWPANDPTTDDNTNNATTDNVDGACARIVSFPRVTFLRSLTDAEKDLLLRACTVLAYTPVKEHFGIVPLEGMVAGTPVVALASGGPLETVVDGGTGYLCENTPRAFAAALRKLLVPGVSERMGGAGRSHVLKRFSFEAFTRALAAYVVDTVRAKDSALPTKGKAAVWAYLFFAFLLPWLGLIGAIVYAMKKRKPSV